MKIAIITTEFLKDFVNSVFKELSLGIETELFIYHSFRDVEELYLSIPETYEGVLTSGIFPAAIIKKCFGETSRTVSYFNTDDAAICRLFLTRFIEDGTIDFNRVYGDFVEVFGIDLISYLTKDQCASYTDLIIPQALSMSVEEICALEEQQLQRHLALHEQEKLDFSVTRFSSIMPQLLERGYKVYFPFPSKDFIQNITEKLIQAITLRHMEDSLPAVINISMRVSDMMSQDSTSFQIRGNALQEALMASRGDSPLDYIIQSTNTGFEILTNKKSVSEDTIRFTCDPLSVFLKNRLPFEVCIGYGIGKDMYQARTNAMNAKQESFIKKSGSFLITENETLIGPLDDAETIAASAYFPTDMEAAAHNSGLSPMTINRVFHAFHSMPGHELTARELANKLSVTKRSANRFLAALQEAGIVKIKTQKRSTTMGRPERVYEIV